MAMKIHRGIGNVFRDLGFPPGEAMVLQLRSELIVHVLRIMKAQGLTRPAAARLFGVTQPRISDLKRGRIGQFSIDGLVKMLSHAGMQVTLKVGKAARGA